jgi:hypothetical protein
MKVQALGINGMAAEGARHRADGLGYRLLDQGFRAPLVCAAAMMPVLLAFAFRPFVSLARPPAIS